LTFERAVEVSLEKDPVYWQALGEFIEAFASAEIMLFSYFVNHAGIPFLDRQSILARYPRGSHHRAYWSCMEGKAARC